MGLVGNGGRLRGVVSDSDGRDRSSGAQRGQGSIIMARAIADAVAATVETGEGHEKQVGIERLGAREGLWNFHRAGNGEIAGTPLPEDEGGGA